MMKKRIVSLLIALVMAVNLLPTVAFAKEPETMSGNCGPYDYVNKRYTDTVKWTLAANDESSYTLTISGNGLMGNAYTTENGVNSGAPEWSDASSKITQVVIEEGVTSVGTKLFKNYTNLKTVVLSNSITKIGQDSFYGSGITSITLPANLTTIEAQAFYKCSSLDGTISVPAGVVSIPMYTFAETGISSIEFHGAVTEIGVNAFMKCSSLTSITLPDTVTTIASGAFSNCTELKSFVFPKNTQFTEISKGTFKKCSKLEEILIPSSVTEIAESAFQGCTALKRAALSNNLSTIGSMAFMDAASMEGVYIPASVSTIPKNNQIFKGMANNSVIYLGSSDLVSLMLQAPSNPNSTENGFDSSKTSLAVTNGGTFAADTGFESGKLATPTKEGAIFAGWYENKNCSGDAVNTPDAGKTYYAKWTYGITFDGNGNTGGDMSVQQVTEGDTSATLNVNTFTKTGYTFAGWNTAKDGSGDPYTDQAIAPTTSTTLYAQWTPNTYTIQFNGGEGAIGTMSEITATYDQPAPLTANGFTKPGCNFAGWATTQEKANAGTVEYSDLTEALNLAESGTVILHAVWTNKKVLTPDVPTQTTKTYNGAEQQAFTLDSTYTISYQQDGKEATPKDAGTYDVVISAKETENTAAYMKTIYGGLVINPAPLTITPKDVTIYVGDPIPKEFEYTVSGLCGTDTLTTELTITTDCEDASYTGTYTISASGASAGNNYNVSYGTGKLTVTEKPVVPSLPPILPGIIMGGAGSMMQRFVDVTSMDYYFDAVQWAVEHGITTGTGKVTFSPDASCTRAQAVTFLWRALGCPAAEKAANFTDVKYGSYYADAVAWAVENGVTVGTSATTFSPDAPCTRAQIVTFLYRAIGVKSATEAGFSDVPANAYYADAVNWAAQYGITGGTGANRFSPNATCTRSQIVTFLYRAN